MARKRGRKGGGSNRGYWHRKGRGWYLTEGTSAIPLCDLNGNHIKDKGCVEEAKAAYARYVLRAGDPAKRGFTVMEACRLYLDFAKKGSAETYNLRRGLLFDLCTGYPAGFQDRRAHGRRSHPSRLWRQGGQGLDHPGSWNAGWRPTPAGKAIGPPCRPFAGP